nr:hypothetical protein CFP56_34591 [Quercus suber]
MIRIMVSITVDAIDGHLSTIVPTFCTTSFDQDILHFSSLISQPGVSFLGPVGFCIFFAFLKANEVESATWDWTNQGESKNSQL